MMVSTMTVDFSVEAVGFTGEQRAAASKRGRQKPLDMTGEEVAWLAAARTFEPLSRRSGAAGLRDARSRNRPSARYLVEAVLLGAIMAAGYLDAAMHVFA